EMGGHVEKQLLAAIDSLVKNDKEQSQKVVLGDAMLDGLQHNIEHKAIATIATRQPMAIDLREVVAVLRIASDLERIGDLAKNIERVGDHATNIAESVYYMVEGRTLSDDRPKADSTSLMRVMLTAAH